MYILPRLMRCSKCGHEGKYSPDDGWLSIHHEKGWRDVVCPVCYANMLKQFCGLMEPAQPKDKEAGDER